MKFTNIRQNLRIAGAALALATVAFGMQASPARASAPSLPPLQGLTNLSLPNSSPSANPLQGLQLNFIPNLQPGYAYLPDLFYAPKWFYYFDYFRGWGFMRVDYVKYNWHTGSKLFNVKLYHIAYDIFGFPYWVESRGSGSEYNNLFTFSCDRQTDGLGQLYFEGKPYEWSTYHPVGDPDEPRWFYIQPY